MNIKGYEIDNTKIIIGAIVLVGVGVGIYFIVRGAKKKSAIDKLKGVLSDKAEQANEQKQNLEAINSISTEIQQTSKIGQQKARQIADQIKNAWGGYFGNDDENAIFSALNQIQNYSDWLLVCQEYGVRSSGFWENDLPNDLISHLSRAELLNVQSILNAKGINVTLIQK